MIFFLIFHILMSALTLRHLLLSTISILSWPALVTWMRANLVPRVFSSFKLSDWRNSWPSLPKWLQKFVRILSRIHDKMSFFRLNNGFKLQETNRAARRWKQPPKKPFHHLGVFQQPWSGVSPILHFEQGEGPGDEVGKRPSCWSSKIERTMSVR